MSLMNNAPPRLKSMPDIAGETVKTSGKLDWVGMSEMEFPIYFSEHRNERQRLLSRVNVFVSLTDAKAKGIHMSRLYLVLDQMTHKDITPEWMREVLLELISSHEFLSNSARIELSFHYLTRRPSLKSDNSGWRKYPVNLVGSLMETEFVLEMGCEIMYSSTCPCSAALARQLLQENFHQTFGEKEQVPTGDVHRWLGGEKAINATPHSQRSLAEVVVKLPRHAKKFPILNLIDQVEVCLKTPVQAAVKREDEQEFARLNGQNLMFCEDACRRIRSALNDPTDYLDFKIRVEHIESLHPHNAVSMTTKGVSGGYSV